MFFIILAICFSIISLLLASNIFNKAFKKLSHLLIILNLIALGVYVFLNFLSGDGINDAVLYHLYFGIRGFGINDYIIPFFLFLIYLILCCWLSSFFYYQLTKFDIGLAPFKKATAFFILLSFLANPFLHDVAELFSKKNEISLDKKFAHQNLLMQNGKQLFDKKKKNIIYLYLEQFERTYFDESIFPGLTPNLKRLEGDAITFTNINSPKSTNWTIAGMVASQCGIPLLVPNYRGNSMSGMDQFLPLARCLGDILNDNGYALNYIGGSSLDFAGKGNFYRSHGFEVIEGLSELRSKSDNSYLSPWGLFDDTLFEILKDRYRSSVSESEPFGIFALTLDTHHPDGYISKSCNDLVYGDGKNPILNSIHCADMLAGRFIEYVKSNHQFSNTTLVVSSDHLALKNSATELLEKGDRKNLFLIFDPDMSPRVITNPGSMFDIAPTVLSSMGVHSRGLGFGRNLFFEPSLIEHESKIEIIIEAHKSKLLSMWSFPQINQDFEISIQNQLINFDSREIKLPVLILLDEYQNVVEMRFDFYFSNPLIKEVNALNRSWNLIWIDQCEPILEHMKVELILNEIQFCSYMFRKSDANYLITDLQREVFDYEKINTFFK